LDKGRKHSKYATIAYGLIGVILVLGILSFFKPFCDWYRANIYSGLSDALTAVTERIPFIVGEACIYLGILLVLGTVVTIVIWLIFRKKDRVRKFAFHWMRSTGMITLVMLLLYMLTWVLPFRASTLMEGIHEKTFTLEELQTLRNYMAVQTNLLALQQNRDGSNHIVYPADMEDRVIAAMKKKGAEYPLLDGKYPHIKMAGFSRILDFMSIGGYTYPFTMEVTCNKYVNKLYFPFLMAHEHSHHQGFYQEDEANFYGFVTLAESDDLFLRYAAYRAVFYDVEAEYWKRLREQFPKDEALATYNAQPHILPLVGDDEDYSMAQSEEYLESEENKVIDSFSPMAENVADVGWSVQEELLSDNYYDGVVALLLDYYKGKLY